MALSTFENFSGDPEKVLITIAGKATVAEAVDIKTALTTAVSRYTGIVVDVTEVSSIDAAFLQLLASTRISAELLGKSFQLTGGSSGVFDEVARLAGFVHDGGNVS